MQTIYLSGPMSGRPRFHYDEFDRWARLLRERDYKVISPAEVSVDYGGLPDFDLAEPESYTKAHWSRAMRHHLFSILMDVDGVAFLNGWDESKGALAEVYVAQTIGLPVAHVEEWFARGRGRFAHAG